MKPQFETYRYVGEICPIKSQSIVECRLPGSEIGSILAIHAQVVPGECTCLDGEVQYGGKLLLSLVYEDLDKKVCRVERGAEFFHKAEDAQVTPSHFCSTELFAENVTWRREGSGLYLSVVVGARLTVSGVKQMEYLLGGEDVIAKKEPISLYKKIAVRGEVEGEDEFDADCVGDILLHSENVVISRMQASNGQIEIEGEMSLHICVLKNDESLCAMERVLPIKMTLPSEEAFGDVVVGGKVQVTSAHLSLQVDEEKETGHVVLSYVLSASCFLTVKEEISVLADGFSLTSEITLKKQNEGGMYLMRQEKGMERIQGSALLSPEIEGEYSLQVALLPRAEINFKKGEKGWEAEGVILAEVLFKNEEGTIDVMISAHRKLYFAYIFVFIYQIKGITAVYVNRIFSSYVHGFVFNPEKHNFFQAVHRLKSQSIVAVCHNKAFIGKRYLRELPIRTLYMLDILKIINVIKLNVQYHGYIGIKIKK